jgi:hypothetical protein
VTIEPANLVVTTPTSVELERDTIYTLTFALEGHHSQAIEVFPEYSLWHAGNLIVGGLIGSEVDQATGAVFNLSPDPAHAELRLLGVHYPFNEALFVSPPADFRATAEQPTAKEVEWTCDQPSPFGSRTSELVHQKLRADLRNSGLFRHVDAALGSSSPLAVQAEIRALCSEIRGFLWLRVLGTTSLRLALLREGVPIVEKSYTAIVTDADDEYTGSQFTTREQARLRTLMDSLHVVLGRFIEDVRAAAAAASASETSFEATVTAVE